MDSAYTDKVIKDLAVKYSLPYLVIRKIVRYQFQFLREKMGEGVKGQYDTFPAVRIHNLGIFIPSRGRIEGHDGSEYEARKRERFGKKKVKGEDNGDVHNKE